MKKDLDNITKYFEGLKLSLNAKNLTKTLNINRRIRKCHNNIFQELWRRGSKIESDKNYK